MKIIKILISCILIVVVVVAGFFTWQWLKERRNEQEKIGSPQGQLGSVAEPLSYLLKLWIDPEEDGFRGEVSIRVRLNEKADHFFLHGSNLTVKESEALSNNGDKWSVKYRELGESGVVRIDLGRSLKPQTIDLSIAYSADFSLELDGLYKAEVAKRDYVFTQFESTDARNAFPCFDEPRFKVPFSMEVIVPKDMVALSNTPQTDESSEDKNNKRIVFAKTKPLPTYLIAFAIGKLDVVDYAAIEPGPYRNNPIPLRGVAVHGKGDQLEFALAHTAELVLAFEEYFKTPYPYAKLDIVAVPDFAAGAMENAGLITFREQLLLLGDNPTLSQKRAYFSVNAHEIAHMWHGDLVTMPWWDDIWLNESFATWAAYKIVHDLYPEFHFDISGIKGSHSVMFTDSYVTARKIREPIKDNGDILNAFDGVTYQKGGAVLYMFENYVGPQIFRQGVQQHLEKYQFGLADVDDFIGSQSAVSKLPELEGAFRSFLDQSGVPLLNIAWQCDANVLNLEIAQSRYLPIASRGDANRQWIIPLCMSGVSDSGKSDHCLLLKDQQVNHVLEVEQCPEVIMPNSGGKGYFRWSVTDNRWRQLLIGLGEMSIAERIAISSNLNSEFRAGRVSMTSVLTAAAAFAKLEDYESKMLPLGTLYYIAEFLVDEEEKAQLVEFLGLLYQPLLDELGLDNDSALDQRDPVQAQSIRNRLVRFFATYLDEESIRYQLKQRGIAYIGFESDQQLHPESINGDLASTAMAVAVQEIGLPYFEALEAQLETSTDGTVRQRLIMAMSQSRDLLLAEKARNLTLSLSLRMNERPIPMLTQLANSHTRESAYEWAKSNYKIIKLTIPTTMLARFPLIISGFCDMEHHRDVSDFFSPKIADIPGAQRNLDDTLERIETCAALDAAAGALKLPYDSPVLFNSG